MNALASNPAGAGIAAMMGAGALPGKGSTALPWGTPGGFIDLISMLLAPADPVPVPQSDAGATTDTNAKQTEGETKSASATSTEEPRQTRRAVDPNEIAKALMQSMMTGAVRPAVQQTAVPPIATQLMPVSQEKVPPEAVQQEIIGQEPAASAIPQAGPTEEQKVEASKDTAKAPGTKRSAAIPAALRNPLPKIDSLPVVAAAAWMPIVAVAPEVVNTPVADTAAIGTQSSDSTGTSTQAAASHPQPLPAVPVIRRTVSGEAAFQLHLTPKEAPRTRTAATREEAARPLETNNGEIARELPGVVRQGQAAIAAWAKVAETLPVKDSDLKVEASRPGSNARAAEVSEAKAEPAVTPAARPESAAYKNQAGAAPPHADPEQQPERNPAPSKEITPPADAAPILRGHTATPEVTPAVAPAPVGEWSREAQSAPARDVSPTPHQSASHALRTAELAQAEVPVQNPAAAREIAMRIDPGGNRAVDIHMTDRGGQLRVDVRSSDPVLQSSLRQDLGTLVNSLDRAGFHTEAIVPTEARSGRTESPSPVPYSAETGTNWDGRGERRQQQQPQSKQRRRAAAKVETGIQEVIA